MADMELSYEDSDEEQAAVSDTIRDLISRHRNESGSPVSKKRERDLSPRSDSTDSPKTPRKDDFTSDLTKEIIGHFIFRAAKPVRDDTLEFIRKTQPKSLSEDPETGSDSDSDDFLSEYDTVDGWLHPNLIPRTDILEVTPLASDDDDNREIVIVPRTKKHNDDDADIDNCSDDLDVTFDKILQKTEHKFEQSSISEDGQVTMVTEEYSTTETVFKTDGVDGTEIKDFDSSLLQSAEDLDFSLLESTAHLNVNANKERVVLRQKGSLANRRKPTRSTVRSSVLSDMDPFSDTGTSSIEVNDTTDTSVEMHNGHDEVFDNTEAMDHVIVELQQSPVRTGLKLPTIKTPIVLPNIVESQRPKLRSTSKPEPVEAPVETEVESPPWLVEARLRKTKTSTKSMSEKSDTELEKPVWMKDALSKRKKMADIIQAHEYTPKDQTQNEDDEPPLAPWMKERQLRKTNRPAPLMATHREINGNVENNVHNESIQIKTNISDNKLIIENESPRWSQKVLDAPTKTHFTKDLTSTKVKDTSSSKRSSIDAGLPTENIVDENTPPKREKETLVLETENLSSYKTQLPPIRSPPSNTQESSSESGIPSWKAEIQARKKSKSHIHAHKLDHPMTLGETPQWKKDLAQKNKLRGGKDHEMSPSQDDLSSSTSNVPSWKQELAKKKRVTPRVLEPIEKTTEQPELDWTKQAEKRRQRLASKGLLSQTEEDIVE